MQEVCYVFFEAGACTLRAAASALASQGLAIREDGDCLVVAGAGMPLFRVSLSEEPHVLIEAMEIAAGTPHEAAMRRFGARFEIAIEDLDEALDEINTLMQIQGALQDASQGYLFLPWNGSLSRPWQAQ